MGRRIIVYPQGLATEAEREHCDALAHFCGGDLQRVFERSGRSLATFLDYAARLRVMHDRRAEALVVLTRTDPLTLLLPARRALEQALPTLSTALWALYWDAARDPELLERARKTGSLEEPANQAPIWTAPNNMSFLILSQRVSADSELTQRVGVLREKPQRSSGVQRVDRQAEPAVASAP
jgi:hypothetical protein